MSKITFRADDDLVDAIEAFDASKSEVMRRALRAYLDDHPSPDPGREGASDPLDAALADRVDRLVEAAIDRRSTPGDAQDVNVTVTLDTPAGYEQSAGGRVSDAEGRRADDESIGEPVDPADANGDRDAHREDSDPAATGPPASAQCAECGHPVAPEHRYCSACGEPTHQVRCECGAEIQSDWSYCPACGSRTAAADVLDRGSSDSR